MAGTGRHGRRTGHTIKIVVRDKTTGRVTNEWHEQPLGPAGRRGSLDQRDGKGGRDCHVAQGSIFGVGQVS